MIIDYIYLILILVLIGSISFIIFLSYEYRINEGFGSMLPSFHANYDLTSHLYQDNNFNNFIIDLNNNLQYKNNMDQLELLSKSNDNVKNANYINQLANGIAKPIPTTFPIDKVIKTIKSKYNSQYISTITNDSSTYGILLNEKCLTVNGLCKDDYCLLDCQNHLFTSDSQKFSTKRIYTDVDAAKAMNVPINAISRASVYPYNIFNSFINNKCLTIGNEGVTVEKCNLNNIKQKWEISPDENICLLE